MMPSAEKAMRRWMSQTTLADVLCGLEPHDVIELWSSTTNQTRIVRVLAIGPEYIVARTDDGPETIHVEGQYLQSCL